MSTVLEIVRKAQHILPRFFKELTTSLRRIIVVPARKGRSVKSNDYEALRAKARKLQAEGKLPLRPTDEQIADWAYGNAVIENEDVTFEMAERAVANKKR
jgi:hypothetical protein